MNRLLSIEAADTRIKLARKYNIERNYARAIKELNFILKHMPSDTRIRVETYLELSRPYREKGDFYEALQILYSALKYDSADPRIYLELGRTYREKGDFSFALRELKSALKHNSSDPRIHLELGRTYYEMKDYDSSIKEFKKASQLDLDEKETIIEFELGRAYRRKGDYHLALRELNSALKRYPSDPYIYLELGRIYREMREYDLCIEEFKRAIQLGLKFPQNATVHLELGRTYREMKKYNLSIMEFKKAFQLGLDDIQARFELIEIYIAKNSSVLAKRELELIKNPYDSRIYFGLEQMYLSKHNYFAAIKVLEQAKDPGIDVKELHISLGKLYRKVGKYELSVNEFKKALEIGPHRFDIFFKNKVLNEIEISERKSILTSFPRDLGVTLSTKCNLKCLMCGVWKESWEIPQKTIQEIIAFFPYLERIVWQGGEVFLLDYFEELFEKAASHPNLRQEIITNGLLINEKWAKKLVSNRVTVDYSIDGITKGTYEYIRKGARFEELIRSINIINEHRRRYKPTDMSITFNFVVMKDNYHEVEKLVDFAKGYRFSTIKISPVEGTTGPENIFFHNDKKAKDYLPGVIPEMAKKAKDQGIYFFNWLPFLNNSAYHQEKSENQREVRKINYTQRSNLKKTKEILCYWPWNSLFIIPGGYVKPQCQCIENIGNIHQSSLQEIWNNEGMQLYRNKIIKNDYANFCGNSCTSGIISREELGAK